MISAPQVCEVIVPTASGLLPALKRIDFADAYEALLRHPNIAIVDAYMAIFGFAPVWVRWLMNLRGFIALRLGLAHPFNAQPLKHAGTPHLQPGGRVGPFTVQSLRSDCIIVGDDDTHLNFRISVLKTERDGQGFITVSTGVEIHNSLGRIYMFVVKPFHRFLARYMLWRAVKEGRL
jgi:hypothetical protein